MTLHRMQINRLRFEFIHSIQKPHMQLKIAQFNLIYVLLPRITTGTKQNTISMLVLKITLLKPSQRRKIVSTTTEKKDTALN